MAFNQIASQRHAELFYLTEATPNTFQASSDHLATAMASATFQVQETESMIREQGRPVPTDVGYHSFHITGQINLPYRFGVDCNIFLSAAMRDTTLPSEVEISPTVDFIQLASGSHLDGDTGAQIKVTGSNGALDGLNAASSQTDSRGALWRISDAATAGNNSANRGPVLVKTGNPRDVAADTFADLDGRFFQTADGWGGDFTGDTLDAVTLDAGAYIGLRNSVPAGNPTYSMIVRFPDLSTTQYFYMTGVILGGPTLSFSGRDQIEWQIPFAAAGVADLTDTDPITGQSYLDTANVYRRPIRGGTEITKLFLATESAIHALEGDEVLNLAISAASAPTMVHDTHGQGGPSGYTLPDFEPMFSFDYQIKEGGKAAALQAIANAHTPVTLVAEFTDSSSNIIYVVMREAIPGSSVIPGIGGDDGPVRGSFAAKVKELGRSDLAMTYHEFSA